MQLVKTNTDNTKIRMSNISFEDMGQFNPRRIRFKLGDTKYVFRTDNLNAFEAFRRKLKTVGELVGVSAEVESNLVFIQLLEFSVVESIEVDTFRGQITPSFFNREVSPFPQHWVSPSIVNLPHRVTTGSPIPDVNLTTSTKSEGHTIDLDAIIKAVRESKGGLS